MNTSMSNARRRLLALANLPKYRDGGPVRGPGTGTSDEVLDEVRPGSYIMPADSTKALGPRTLADVAGRLMSKEQGSTRIPVRLSNGEYKLSPEQVQAVGASVLDVLRGVTHQPVGYAAQSQQGYADGGKVRPARMDAADDPRSTVYHSADPYAASNAMRMSGLANSIGSRGVMELGRAPAPQPPTARNSFGDAAAATVDPMVTQLPQLRRPAFADGGRVDEVTRVGNSYSGGNVGGNITINGQAPGGTYSSPGASAAPAPATASQPAMSGNTGSAGMSGPSGGLSGIADRLQQIPTGGMTAPPADGSQSSWANTDLGRNITNAASALPGVAGALPAITQTGGAISNVASAASRLMNVGAGFGGMSAVPAFSLADSPPSSASRATAPVSSGSSAATLETPSPVGPDAPSQSSLSGDSGTIRRIDRPGQSPLFTNLQDSNSDLQSFMARPAGGPSAQNSAAADNLAASSQAESLGRVQVQIALEEEARRNSPEAMRARAMDTLASQKPGSRKAAEAMFNAANNMDRERTSRESNALESQRYAASDRLARDEFGLKQAMAGFQNRSAQRMENAQVAYEQAGTPALRAAARDRLLALAGKAHEDQWKAVALQGGTDAMGNKTESILGAVNERTGEMRRMDAGKAAPPAKEALVKGQVYQTARGPAVWDGAQFRAQ